MYQAPSKSVACGGVLEWGITPHPDKDFQCSPSYAGSRSWIEERQIQVIICLSVCVYVWVVNRGCFVYYFQRRSTESLGISLALAGSHRWRRADVVLCFTTQTDIVMMSHSVFYFYTLICGTAMKQSQLSTFVIASIVAFQTQTVMYYSRRFRLFSGALRRCTAPPAWF